MAIRMCKLLLIVFGVAIVMMTNIGSAYRLLLVFPFPGKSHMILSEGYLRHLLRAGHVLTHVTPMPLKDPPSNLRQIDVSSNFNLIPMDEMISVKKMMKSEVDINDISVLFDMMFNIANATVMDAKVQELLRDPQEKFDAVLVEWLYTELYSGFSTVFNCPLIWTSTVEVHHMVLSLIDENPNPAYTADIITGDMPPFSFFQRAQKLWSLIKINLANWLKSFKEEEIYKNAFGPAVEIRGNTLPPFNDVKYNASLMLGNSHVSIGQSLRLPQNYIPIAGYHINEKFEPMSKDLRNIFENATHGLIYFSMGSMLRSASFPETLIRGLLNTFAQFKQKVVWKFEGNLENVPNNVHVIKWAPQPSILAHPNTILFITHGGTLSSTETIHFGVPIIGIPVYADQFSNVVRAEQKGYGKRVNLDFDTPVKLKAAIEDILSNPRYMERARELSMVYHDRPVSAGAAMVHWVEHVVRTRGAPHLRSPALAVSLYQKMYLDLVITILILPVLVIIAYIKFIRIMNKKPIDENKRK